VVLRARGEGPVRSADLRAEAEAGEEPADEVPVLRAPVKPPEPKAPAMPPRRPRKKKQQKEPGTWEL